MFYRSGLISLALFVLFSCGNEQKFAEKKDLTQEERIQIEKNELEALLDFDTNQDSVKLFNFWITTGSQLAAFYTKTNGDLFWFSDGKMKPHTASFLTFLSQTQYYGLDSNFYYLDDLQKGLDSVKKHENFYAIAKTNAAVDLLLTNAWLLLYVHLQKGFLDPETNRVVWKIDSLSNKNLADVLITQTDTSIATNLKKVQPGNIEYRYLQKALVQFVNTHELDTISFKTADPKKDSTACWTEVVKAMVHWKYIASDTIPRDSIVKAVKQFQSDNGLDPDAVIGNFSRKSFGTSNAKRYYYACLALEKWRWKEKRDSTIRFHVNIPSYTLQVIRNDSIVRRHRVVTGAPDTRSPQFKAKIKWITLYPYWHVPHSISSKEIAPFLRRDSSYLRKNGYQLLNFKNEPIDLSTVKWKKLCEDYFPYKVRQNGGPGNSLGIVAFHFPNKFDVYLHDTPSKRFFNKTMRAFSHGCIRLQHPVNMAEFILKQDRKWKKDEFNMDTLMSWIDKRVEQRIYLKKPIPIEIDYITVTSDSIGNIHFHPDVYEKEMEQVELMNPRTTYKAKPVKKKAEATKQDKVTVMVRREEVLKIS